MSLGAGRGRRRPAAAVPERGWIEIGPLTVAPNQSLSVDTLLLAQIPPPEGANGSGSRLPALDLNDVLSRTCRAWAAASVITTEDATVREVFDKARLACRAWWRTTA